MSSKLGRPPKENSKKLRFEVRLNQEQVDVLNECAENLKISKTDVVIKGIELVKEKLDKNK
ncbi:CopG family transcriptional regulator [Clostridioides difficile]|nr:CopG family transcriptional regulator [Clostridioides difficile]